MLIQDLVVRMEQVDDLEWLIRADIFRHINEDAVLRKCRVQCRKSFGPVISIFGIVLTDQVGVLPGGLTQATIYDTVAEGGKLFFFRLVKAVKHQENMGIEFRDVAGKKIFRFNIRPCRVQ